MCYSALEVGLVAVFAGLITPVCGCSYGCVCAHALAIECFDSPPPFLKFSSLSNHLGVGRVSLRKG